MIDFILGFIACLVIAILWPSLFVAIKARAAALLAKLARSDTPPMMLLAIAVAIPFALSACAAPKAVAAPTYPVWLEMKDGYAETCAAAGPGGCVPMTQEELRALVMDVHQKTLAMCRRSSL